MYKLYAMKRKLHHHETSKAKKEEIWKTVPSFTRYEVSTLGKYGIKRQSMYYPVKLVTKVI